jgi:hypothetical protein
MCAMLRTAYFLLQKNLDTVISKTMTHIIMSHGVIPRYNSDLYHMMSDDIQFIPIYTNWRTLLNPPPI